MVDVVAGNVGRRESVGVEGAEVEVVEVALSGIRGCPMALEG